MAPIFNCQFILSVLSYEETYELMLEPMLDIFTEHFQLFCGQMSALRFVYSAFSCEVNMVKKSYMIKHINTVYD